MQEPKEGGDEQRDQLGNGVQIPEEKTASGEVEEFSREVMLGNEHLLVTKVKKSHWPEALGEPQRLDTEEMGYETRIHDQTIRATLRRGTLQRKYGFRYADSYEVVVGSTRLDEETARRVFAILECAFERLGQDKAGQEDNSVRDVLDTLGVPVSPPAENRGK